MFSTIPLMVFICVYITTKVLSSPVTVGDGLVNKELNGKELIKMGKVLNKPLLTLLGETFVKMEQDIVNQFSEKIDDTEMNLQKNIDNLTKETSNEREVLKQELCKIKSCTEWTEWSGCSTSVIRTFGASTRTRTCGGRKSICPSNVVEKGETESKICQGTECKSNEYTKTKNEFCIRLNKSVQKPWKDAQKECNQDGGHLINIDDVLKAADVDETLEKMSFTSTIWIDGTRTVPNGVWKYEYGSKDTAFSKWKVTEPGSNDDCRAYVVSEGKRWWFGRSCTSAYYFICEML